MGEKDRYALGYSEEEDRRLAQQAAVLEPLTEDVYRRAGVGRGMRVLDLGCGVGDVAMIAARLVGPQGSVLGVDRSEASIATARRRAERAGHANITYRVAEIAAFEPPATFDAIVGRLILLYLPDPAATLRRLGRSLEPGGLAAFQEMDMPSRLWATPGTLAERAGDWINAAFAVAGVPTEMGERLPAIFIDAGFPRPDMLAGQSAGSGPGSPLYAWLAATARSLLPVMERANIATAAEVDIDTLADRLRDEGVRRGLVMYSSRMVGAWARKP